MPEPWRIQRIVVGTDFSDSADRAVKSRPLLVIPPG
jgi:hypothetical protein